MDNPQSNQEKPTLEQRLTEIATKGGITLRELKETVFQLQRQENKSLKDVNEGFEEMLKNQQFHITQKEIRNQEIKLELEYAEIKPLYDDLMKKRSQPVEPKKKKKFF
jgi:predicted nucleic-acid-binding protein